MEVNITVRDVLYIAGILGGAAFNAAYIRGKIMTTLETIQDELKILRANVRYVDTCEEAKHGLERRITRLEVQQNGRAK